MIILDTNVVSELVRRRTAPAVAAWFGTRRPGDFAVTSISVFELRFGLELLEASRRRDELAEIVEEFLASLTPDGLLALDRTAAVHAARFRAERQLAGRPTSVPDSLIAGIALRHGAALATRNIRDFEDSGLALIDPWQAVP